MATGTSNPVVPVDVFTGQDFYVPSFRVFKGSKPLNLPMEDVLSVTYNDSLTAIDSFDLTVNNSDPDKASAQPGVFRTSPFKYSDEATFNPWQQVELWMGYIRNGVDERQKMLTGEIATMSPNFPASGGSTLTVKALNLLHRFRTKQQTTAFFQKRDSEVAEMIVKGIAAEIKKHMPQVTLRLDHDEIEANKKKEKKIDYLIMNNQYPILFLLERSRDIGYELFVEEIPTTPGPRFVTLHYRPTGVAKRVVYRLEWGKSLISFQPTLQTANQVGSVTVRGWDAVAKKKIEKTFERSKLKGVVQPVDLHLDDVGLTQKAEIAVDHPIQGEQEALAIAEKRMLQIAQRIVEAKGKTVGLPNLRAGNKIEIKGLGTRFSGIYLVTSTTHTMGDGGYTTDFAARMETN